MRNVPTQPSLRPKQQDYLFFPAINIFIPALLSVLIAVIGTAWTFTLASKPQLASKAMAHSKTTLKLPLVQPTLTQSLTDFLNQNNQSLKTKAVLVPSWQKKNTPLASHQLEHPQHPPLFKNSYPICLDNHHKNFGASSCPPSGVSALTMNIQTKSILEKLERQPLTPSKLSEQSSATKDNSWQPLANLPLLSPATLQPTPSLHSQREVFSQVSQSPDAASGVETKFNQNQPQSPSQGKEITLTLSDAVILALENNRPLKNAYLERIVQRQELAVAEDKFVPDWTPTVSLSIAQLGQNSTTTDGDIGVGATVAVKIPTGGELSFSWVTNSQPLTQSNLITTSNDDPFGQNLQLRFSQPLLRGAGIYLNRASIEIARLTEQINLLNLKSILINTITDTILAYREWLRAQEQLKIAQLSLQSAQESLENYRILIEAGRLAPVDIVQAETDIANQQVRLIEAENNLESTRLALLNILDIDPDIVIVPAELPKASPIALNAEKLRQLAFSNQPEYLKAQLDRERTKLDLLQAENNRLWDLNLNTSYDYTLSNSNKGDVRVGLALSRQLGDLTVERDFQRSRINKLQAENTWEEQQESLELQLKDRLRDVQLSFSQVELAQKATKLSERQLEIAKEKQKLGREITVFELIELQDDLAQARNLELNATINYLNALTRLDQTLGTTLETWQITIERTEELNREHN